MLKRVIVYGLMALLVAAGVWFAVEPHKRPAMKPPGANEVTEATTVTYAGKLSERNVELFLDAVKGKKLTMLVISSSGGEINAGIKMGSWVFDNHIDVAVEKMCLSSCANYVFPAGRRKTIRPGAVVAWHGKALQESGMSDEEVRAQVIGAFNTLPESEKEKTDLEDLIGQAIARTRQQRTESLKRHSEFFRKIGVDESVCRIGNEKYGAKDLYFLSVKDMARFRIYDVEAPADYEKTDLAPLLIKGKQIDFIKVRD